MLRITPRHLKAAKPEAVRRLASFLGVQAVTWELLVYRLVSACRPARGSL